MFVCRQHMLQQHFAIHSFRFFFDLPPKVCAIKVEVKQQQQQQRTAEPSQSSKTM